MIIYFIKCCIRFPFTASSGDGQIDYGKAYGDETSHETK